MYTFNAQVIECILSILYFIELDSGVEEVNPYIIFIVHSYSRIIEVIRPGRSALLNYLLIITNTLHL